MLLLGICLFSTLFAARSIAATATWTLTSGGPHAWNVNTNPPWDSADFPDLPDDVANLNLNITANQVYNLNQAISLGTLNMGDTTGGQTMTINPNGGSLIFDVTAGNAVLNKVAGGGLDTISAAITLNDTLDLSASAPIQVTGAIGGNGGININSGTDVTFTVGNAYLGTTVIDGSGSGRLRINNAAGLGSILAGTTVNATGRLHMNANITYNAEPLTLNGGSLWGQNGQTPTWTGLITLTADSSIKMDNSGTLNINPAAGNAIDLGNFTLTFAGRNIADNADDYDPNFTVHDPIIGNGGITFQAGTVLTLNGTNTYSGDTTISRNIMRANDTVGLPNASFLVLNSTDAGRPSIWETSANIARTTDTVAGAGKVNVTNFAGFSANGGAVAASLNGGAALTWGSTAGFNPTTLVLQAGTANNTLDFQNDIDFNGAARTVQVNSTTAFPATMSGALSGAGGGLTKTGNGLLILSNAGNNYGGATTVSGGILRADNGSSLPSGSLLTLNGGVLETGTNLARAGGAAAGNMQITGGNSGFSANGGPVQVAFGTLATPTALTWGTAPFQPAILILNAATANNTIELLNDINLNGAARTVQVDANTATLSGDLSGAGASGLTKTGDGRLNLPGTLSYTGTTTFSDGMLVMSGSNTGTLGAINAVNSNQQASGWMEVVSGANYSASSLSVTGNFASLHMSGGSLSTTGAATVGGGGNTNEFLYMSGGSLSVGGDAKIGGDNGSNQNDQGTFIMSGGSFTVTGSLRVGTSHNSGGNTLAMGSGTTTVNGTAITLAGSSRNPNNSWGRIFLAGDSVLEANQINRNTPNTPAFGESTVYFNGGTLVALSDNTDFLGPLATPANGNTAIGSSTQNMVRVYAGGVTIDTNTFDVTVNPALLAHTSTANNGIDSASLVNLGSGYSIAPTISFSGGGGSGATAVAALGANGTIDSIIITNPGAGYTSTPTINISGGTLIPGGVAANNSGASVSMIAANSGGLTKKGLGTLTLAANSTANTYTGITNVNAGTLLINGTHTGGGNIVVAANSVLGGSGQANSLVTGAGLGSPGNSPGILTVSQTDPSGGMDFAFELTAIGDPLWSNAGASVNDVWRNTHVSDPFAGGTFDSDNVIDIYFGVGVLASGDMFRGGFFTDFNSDFLSTVSAASYNYWVLGDTLGTDTTFEGQGYYSLANYDSGLGLNVGTVQIASADFAGGTINNGWVMRFDVIEANLVPEPSALAMAALGLLGLGLVTALRRRCKAK